MGQRIRLSWIFALFHCLAVYCLAQTGGSQVTISINEYERLRQRQQQPSITVVDTLRFAGSFKDRTLSVELLGQSAGEFPAVVTLNSLGGAIVHGCSGDQAVVSRNQDGALVLTPLATRFDIRCQIASSGSDRLELFASPSVLWIEANVKDGELIRSAPAKDGSHSFSIVRMASGLAENLQTSATGRYRITLMPESTLFRYQFEIHNPNRSSRPFAAILRSGEHVQNIDGPASYEVFGNLYSFEVPPGDTTMVVTGNLSGASFVAPVAAKLQYLLIESHPLLRPQVETRAKRVSPVEVGIPAQFAGPQAFLLETEEATRWNITKLEAIRTADCSVNDVRHTFYFSDEGTALGESTIAMENQGASEIVLPMKAVPTFAGLQGQAVLLTRNAQGSLWLPLSQGEQNLFLQHRQALHRIPGLAMGSLALPELSIAASSTMIELRYPDRWVPLYERFASQSRFHSPSTGKWLMVLLLVFWSERTLMLLGLPRKRRLILAGLITAVATAFILPAMIFVLANLSITLIWSYQRLQATRGGRTAFGFMILLVVVLLLWLYSAVGRTVASMAVTGSGGLDAVSDVSPFWWALGLGRENRAMMMVGGSDVGQYQGLPARVQIPDGNERSFLYQEMLSSSSVQRVSVLMLSRTVITSFHLVLLGLAFASLWSARTLLAEGWAMLKRGYSGTPA